MLEERVKNCQVCRAHRKTPVPAALHPWEWASRPCIRIHIDYAGPFMGKMFVLVIDAHSKWRDVHCVSSATTEKPKTTFATHGLPDVSGYGSVFTSEDFNVFTRRNGMTRNLSSIPSLFEWFGGQSSADFQTRHKEARQSIETKLAHFLLSYRTAPQTTTSETPAQLR